MSKPFLAAYFISLLTTQAGQNATNSRVAWLDFKLLAVIRADTRSPWRPFGDGGIMEAITTFHSFLFAIKRKADCPLDAVVYNNNVSVVFFVDGHAVTCKEFALLEILELLAQLQKGDFNGRSYQASWKVEVMWIRNIQVKDDYVK